MLLRARNGLSHHIQTGARLLCASAAAVPPDGGDGRSNPGEKVGFIGLGQMGSRMANNLMLNHCELVVCDASPRNLSDFLKRGGNATGVGSPQEVASMPGVRAIITMLPSSSHVREVYCGSEGIFAAEGGVIPSLLIDTSTIDPMTSQDMAAAARKARLHHDATPFHNCSVSSPTFVDAPVSGGVTGAAAATLTFMCGGDKAAIDAASQYLRYMGKNVRHCGPAGSGQAAKLCNNLALAIQMAGVAEGLALGRRLGLDPALLSEVFNTSSARSWTSETYNPAPGVMDGVPASRDYQGGFATRLMVKDLGLAQAAAQSVEAPIPMGLQALQVYQQAVEQGAENLDFGSIYRFVYGEGEKT